MSSPLPMLIPFLIVAVVTWKISYSKKTSKFTGASPSLRAAKAKGFNQISPWKSSISERLAARGVQQSRTKGSGGRSSLSNAKRILNKQQPEKPLPLAEREKRERRS